jgi:putative SOS response-associated peptidase YedK
MCGRYAAAKDPDALVEEFEVDESLVETPLKPDYNVAPTKSVYAVLSRASDDEVVQRQLRVVRWGLVPSWAKDPSIGSRMINARSETVADKPAFRRAFAKRRCLLPADGYYEWYTPQGEDAPKTAKGKPVKQPFYIQRADGRTLAMAGLYEWWHDASGSREDPDSWLLTATIITTAATDDVGRIHDRMPVVVSEQDWGSWLDPTVDQDAVRELMLPAQAVPLSAYPVSTRVNSVRNNDADLREPLPAT